MANYEALTEAIIDAMKTWEVYKLLDEIGVDEKDLEPAEAKATLKLKVQELRKEAGEETGPEQVANMMVDIAKSYNTTRELLLQRCQDVTNYLPTLDQNDRDKLTAHFGRDVMKILEEVKEHLSKDDCPLLIAGETSAGKTTLLNLLLGDDILPVAHLSSTSAICEVKYGAKRQAVITYPLSANAEECRKQIAAHIHPTKAQRENQRLPSKIEIFWKLAILKGGVIIVDSPGVGESEAMDKIIAEYIPSAFAFIYIIDSSRAGGVQQDRLGRLLLKCKEEGARSELEQFDPEKAIFVLNKWDLVPTEEREEVKEETIRKLREMWPGLEESQVFIFSNKETVTGGFRPADLAKLLDGIYELLPQTLNHKLYIQYRRMFKILEETLTYVRLKLNDAFRILDEGERQGAYMEAQSALTRFDQSSDLILEELTCCRDDSTVEAAHVCAEVLKGERLRNHLSEVSIEAKDDEDAIFKELSLKIVEFLMKEHEPFNDHMKDANQQFLSKLQAMVTRLNHEHCESIRPLTGRRIQLTAEDGLSHDRIRPKRRRSGPYLRRLQLSEHHALKPSIQEYRKNKDRSRLCEIAIAAMATEDGLRAIAKHSLRDSYQLLSDLKAELRAVKEVDRRLVEERFAETRSQMELVSRYEPQACDLTRQLSRLAMVNLTKMREFEFDLDSIFGWGHPQNRIGGGSYGEVYSVQVERAGVHVRAALKLGVLPYDITTEENAWNFLIEENNLRKLRGEHIVQYYGAACRREEGGLRLGLVMELCAGTLEDRIIGRKEHNPTWWRRDLALKQRAFSYIQDKAIQLCEGLRNIHNAGYIHRDLKLGNILVTAGNVVKMADVGVTKREVNVTGTVTGTAVYAAPEVKERKVYDKSADIYSLGLILWEMWYGRTVWQAMEDPSLRGLTEGGSMMMPDSPDSVRPIPDWAALVQDCVNKVATRRPSALDCLQRIRGMQV